MACLLMHLQFAKVLFIIFYVYDHLELLAYYMKIQYYLVFIAGRPLNWMHRIRRQRVSNSIPESNKLIAILNINIVLSLLHVIICYIFSPGAIYIKTES